MREIKFRAWDIICNEMVNEVVQFNDECWVYIGITSEHGYLNDFEIMQYTGLKDKNGKEIFEGDILTRSKRPNSGFVFVVSFGNGSFAGYTEPGRNHWLTLERAMNMEGAEYDEIIGNIHKHPELLTAKVQANIDSSSTDDVVQ